jgi:hypothetical protein
MEREGIVEIKGTKGAGWRGIHSWTCNVVVSWWIIQTHVGPNKKDVTWLWVGLDRYKMSQHIIWWKPRYKEYFPCYLI